MATKQIKPKAKDREATEERLLLAAEQVFSKFGFKGATTRMIAKKANINVALINRYFDGIYGLFLKVLELKHREIDESILPYTLKDTITEECMSYANYKFELCIKDLNFFRIAIAQFLTDPKFLKKFQETLLTFENFTTFEERLEVHVAKGTLPKEVNIKALFDTIECYIFGLIIGDIIIRGIPKEELKESMSNFVNLLCRSFEK